MKRYAELAHIPYVDDGEPEYHGIV